MIVLTLLVFYNLFYRGCSVAYEKSKKKNEPFFFEKIEFENLSLLEFN